MNVKTNKVTINNLRKIWKQVPPNYYDQGIANNLLQKLWHSHKLYQIKKLLSLNTLKKNLYENSKILDVGCSSGILTAEVSKLLPQSKVTGLDCYKAAIDFANSKYPHLTFVMADAHQLPFKNKVFDLVICTETLEHLVDPERALLEIKRVLKNNGFVIISMDSGNLLFRLVWYFWTKTRGRVWQNAHLHNFNAEILEKLILKTGFKIKRKIISHLGMAITFLAVPEAGNLKTN